MFKVVRTPRLVRSPVFLLSAPRSGGTLTRWILDTHSQIHAPVELTLTGFSVTFPRFRTEVEFGAVGLDVEELEYMLWDRVLERELNRSGKAVLVHRAPGVLFQWRRLMQCWAEARYIFLLRHPANIYASGQAVSGADADRGSRLELLDAYLRALYQLQAAREELSGLTVRYEDLVANPARNYAAICEFLGLEWEPAMLDYGAADHGVLTGSGDFGRKLRSGHIHTDRPMPADDEIPLPLRPICASLGYSNAADSMSPARAKTEVHTV
ncbi:MAG: sulfotransferase family protein [Streptomycetales bacterium]